jgi:hypothetical protein
MGGDDLHPRACAPARSSCAISAAEFGQGYLFSRPLEFEAALEYLRLNREGRRPGQAGALAGTPLDHGVVVDSVKVSVLL